MLRERERGGRQRATNPTRIGAPGRTSVKKWEAAALSYPQTGHAFIMHMYTPILAHSHVQPQTC